MKTQTGRAILYGSDGTMTWASVTANTERELQGVKLKDRATVKEALDRNGNTLSACATNPQRDATFDFMPLAGSGADTLANAKKAIEFPALLEKITIASLADNLNGDWQYVGDGESDLTNEGFVKMTLPCRRWNNTTLPAVT